MKCLPSGMRSLFNRGNAYFIGVAPREKPGLKTADGTGACPACPVECEAYSSGVALADGTGA